MAQSNPGVDAIRGLSFSLALSFGPRGFSPGTSNSNSTGNQLDEEPVSAFPLPINPGTPLIRSPTGQKFFFWGGGAFHRGRLEFHDLRAVLTNLLYIAFAFLNNCSH